MNRLDAPFEHAGSYDKIEEVKFSNWPIGKISEYMNKSVYALHTLQTLVTLDGEERLVMTNDVGNITSAGTMTRTFSVSKEGIEEVKQI